MSNTTRSVFAFSSQFTRPLPNGYTDALSTYAGLTGFYLLRDRFGYLNKFSPYTLYEPSIPLYTKDTSLNIDVTEMMDRRASVIYEESKLNNKDIYIFLSGGVDSTAMTIAFLKVVDDLSHLHIVYTKYTIEEYPEFVEYLKHIGIDMMLVLPILGLSEARDTVTSDGDIAVLGWCADQIFGSIVNQEYPGWYNRDWHDFIQCRQARSQFEEAFDYYNLPIRTFGELTWWMNFSCKYDYVKYDYVLSTGKFNPDIVIFYDTPEFNIYSVSHFDKLHKYPQNNTKYYKLPLKEYIYNFNKDRRYLLYKGKTGSWCHYDVSDGEDTLTQEVTAIVMETPDTVSKADAGVSHYIRDFRFEESIDKLRRYILNMYLKDEYM